MTEEYKIGREYEVDGQKAIYMGKTNISEFFLSVESGGAITEHIRNKEGIKRNTYTQGSLYDLLKQNLEDLLGQKVEDLKK